MSLQTALCSEPLVADGALKSPAVAVISYEMVLKCLVVDAYDGTTVVGAYEVFVMVKLAMFPQSPAIRESLNALVAVEPEKCMQRRLHIFDTVDIVGELTKNGCTGNGKNCRLQEAPNIRRGRDAFVLPLIEDSFRGFTASSHPAKTDDRSSLNFSTKWQQRRQKHRKFGGNVAHLRLLQPSTELVLNKQLYECNTFAHSGDLLFLIVHAAHVVFEMRDTAELSATLVARVDSFMCVRVHLQEMFRCEEFLALVALQRIRGMGLLRIVDEFRMRFQCLRTAKLLTATAAG